MIAANQEVFGHFDEYLSTHGKPAANAGQPRWIATDDEEEADLKRFRLTEKLRLSPSKILARFDDSSDQIFVAIGLDFNTLSNWLSQLPPNAGILTAIIADLKPKPSADPLTVHNIVSAQDKRDAGYVGHTPQDIGSLFPNISLFYGKDIDPDDTHKIFFDLLNEDAVFTDNWINHDLTEILKELHTLTLIGLPYQILSKSLVEYDPSSLYLALYRCLESLYSFAGAQEVRTAFGLSMPWQDVSATLESSIGWRPIELGALEKLVRKGALQDWEAIIAAISPAFSEPNGKDKALSSTKLIYKLRNSVVHYRPIHSRVELDLIDWEPLCKAMVNLISYVYSDIFNSI